ncbi:hypothetical protein BDY21DRAFT_375898 [Lineolata rhizophorae]|uniref:Uncharacterized protein n=1 Tax=Lineolata rhizophorae TaxID=578093 RepID=A0A6A6PDW0_9PEZI|nr:hypothetical protein BDY21DRAFT_375898 [Lineolata rhizophorae]
MPLQRVPSPTNSSSPLVDESEKASGGYMKTSCEENDERDQDELLRETEQEWLNAVDGTTHVTAASNILDAANGATSRTAESNIADCSGAEIYKTAESNVVDATDGTAESFVISDGRA